MLDELAWRWPPCASGSPRRATPRPGARETLEALSAREPDVTQSLLTGNIEANAAS